MKLQRLRKKRFDKRRYFILHNKLSYVYIIIPENKINNIRKHIRNDPDKSMKFKYEQKIYVVVRISNMNKNRINKIKYIFAGDIEQINNYLTNIQDVIIPVKPNT